jgi:hypothetical protein
MSRKTLEQRLADLESMPGAELSVEWERVYKAPAPKLSADLLRIGIAWRLQEKQLGGLSRTARQVLQASDEKKAKSLQQRKLTPGTRLVRHWRGTGHSVTVVENGFDYEGRRWPSLTAIARHITGAKWSCPRFFGLTGGAS